MHEIHITVDNADVNFFKVACSNLKVKPVLIAMQKPGGTFHHLMTSYTMRGNVIDVRETAEHQTRMLHGWGFDVSRIKIETTLTNPMILYTSGYFESHMEIIVPVGMEMWEDKVRAISPDAHLSRNAFKSNSDVISHFVTLRKSGRDWTPTSFNHHIADTVEGLSEHFKLGKVRSEFAWYDSNISIDNEWRPV